MTDIAFKHQIDSLAPQPGYFNDGNKRKEVGTYNTNTHFIFGKHPTVHLSEARLKTQLRTGL